MGKRNRRKPPVTSGYMQTIEQTRQSRSRREPVDYNPAWGLPQLSTKVVLPQRMPGSKPIMEGRPIAKGPRYSVDPTNPLGLKGHEGLWISEQMIHALEVEGYVVMKVTDLNARLRAARQRGAQSEAEFPNRG